ncbi:MAG: ATP-binding protein, partial [Desulfobacterales bacterium]
IQKDLDNMDAMNAGKISGFNIDKRYLHADGSTVWINMTIAPVKVEDEAHPRHLCMVEDITDRRHAQEEKDKIEAQLQQAQKMEAIGTLSGGIAHDFNNILGVIMGCTELSLMETPKEAPIHEYLSEVIKATDRARDLVKQILAFSRQGSEEEAPLAIGIIIKEALKMLRSSLPSTIEIKQNIQKDVGLIMADPTQIHRIIMNLATNASQAMAEEGGEIDFRLEGIAIDDETAEQNPDLKSGPYVKLTVSDTGHGMAPDIVARIFEPYYTTKSIGEGTGLGLSVIHGIVQSHNGAIAVSSEPGRGTTFELYFPKIEFVGDRSETGETVNIPTGTERILFVDDEPSMARIYESMLQHLGYEASVRTSSREALEAFKAQPDKYDLVITDQTMPHLTGQMLARELVAIRPGIPIILCTGHSDSVNEDKMEAVGIRALVMKPISMAEIANAIRDVLDPASSEE